MFDGHNDLPWEIRNDTIARKDPAKYDLRTRSRGHTDIARLRRGMVGAQFWSVYVPADMQGKLNSGLKQWALHAK